MKTIKQTLQEATNKKTIADFEQWFYEKQLAA
jgi:hypothetical protein